MDTGTSQDHDHNSDNNKDGDYSVLKSPRRNRSELFSPIPATRARLKSPERSLDETSVTEFPLISTRSESILNKEIVECLVIMESYYKVCRIHSTVYPND